MMWPLSRQTTPDVINTPLEMEEPTPEFKQELEELRKELELSKETLSLYEQEMRRFVNEKTALFQAKEEVEETNAQLRLRIRELESPEHIAVLQDELQDSKDENQALQSYNYEVQAKNEQLERSVRMLPIVVFGTRSRLARVAMAWRTWRLAATTAAAAAVNPSTDEGAARASEAAAATPPSAEAAAAAAIAHHATSIKSAGFAVAVSRWRFQQREKRTRKLVAWHKWRSFHNATTLQRQAEAHREREHHHAAHPAPPREQLQQEPPPPRPPPKQAAPSGWDEGDAEVDSLFADEVVVGAPPANGGGAPAGLGPVDSALLWKDLEAAVAGLASEVRVLQEGSRASADV